MTLARCTRLHQQRRYFFRDSFDERLPWRAFAKRQVKGPRRAATTQGLHADTRAVKPARRLGQRRDNGDALPRRDQADDRLQTCYAGFR